MTSLSFRQVAPTRHCTSSLSVISVIPIGRDDSENVVTKGNNAQADLFWPIHLDSSTRQGRNENVIRMRDSRSWFSFLVSLGNCCCRRPRSSSQSCRRRFSKRWTCDSLPPPSSPDTQYASSEQNQASWLWYALYNCQWKAASASKVVAESFDVDAVEKGDHVDTIAEGRSCGNAHRQANAEQRPKQLDFHYSH